jgi:hypothetical protein
MPDPGRMPGLAALEQALARADMNAVRLALLALGDEERRVLEARLGADSVQRLYARVRRRRRGPARGRVVVIHGIMGAQLDAVDGDGDADRIWLNVLRLFVGRIADLALTVEGEPAQPGVTVRIAGLFPEYLPLLAELETEWDVLPFAFDWRLDVDLSAQRLARAIHDWAGREPVHIVAHSMGGLVARRFIQLHPDVWRDMRDPSGSRGGRLVMLGTPNQGSYAIPMVLTGEEKTVRMLALLDVKHDLDELLAIIGTFLGSYQMLPSPRVSTGDDHARLFDRATWGSRPVLQPLLDRGRALQDALHVVTDADRLVYVAGFDQPTPFRVKVDGPGRFRYQETRDGDGRVPHELGLLAGVRTFWVNEVHGDLPKNERVLAGIHELLSTGGTAALDAETPRPRRAVPLPGWRRAVDIDPIPEEFALLVPAAAGGRSTRAPRLTAEAAARLEAVVVRDWIGTREAAPAPVPAGAAARRARPAPIPLRLEVVWGDITRTAGDVYAVGHYQGVLPQFAELALDRMVSGPGASGQQLVLTTLTRRGVLRGALGDVDFFPWAGREGRGRIVAIAGMGHPGAFGRGELRLLARNLTWAIVSLPDPKAVCTVLIGSGAGNLSVPAAVEGLLAGMVEALGQPGGRAGIEVVRVVERNLGRALAILDELRRLREDVGGDLVDLRIARRVRHGRGGRVGPEPGLALALAAAAAAYQEPARSARRRAMTTVLGRLPVAQGLREQAARALEQLSPADDLLTAAATLEITRGGSARDDTEFPIRISFVADGRAVRAAALTQTAVVPEREIGIDPALVDETVRQMTDPDPARVAALSTLLARLLVPRDFRDLLAQDRPVVFEVDRTMARVLWEMVSTTVDGAVPVALRSAFARQLRTGYSPPPTTPWRSGGRLRALVVGDPGDPAAGESLPGARREALEVAALLRAKGLDVVVMIGAPSARREPALRGIAPAARLEVLNQLLQGGFDVLHYAGHGDFDPEDPRQTGWLFEDGLLTSRELERVDAAPRLVVANACLSARTSDALARGTRARDARTEIDLLPGLADEFFRRGVRNYLGTAWEVNDEGAIVFARRFYERALPSATTPADTLGEAILRARQELKKDEVKYGALWAAYQHYGDPTLRLVADAPARGETRGRRAPARSRATRGG